MQNIRAPRYASADKTLIDCEIEVAGEWLPFTASADDVEPHGRDIHARLLAGEVGEIAPYEPPAPPAPQPVTDVSFWQFIMAAASLQIITWAEAEAAVATRAIPAQFAEALDTLPEPQRTMARIKYMGISRVLRADDLFGLMVATGKATDEQIDAVFAVAATIT